jgi:hypothetical protein
LLHLIVQWSQNYHAKYLAASALKTLVSDNLKGLGLA